jgi:hypothetical protein
MRGADCIPLRLASYSIAGDTPATTGLDKQSKYRTPVGYHYRQAVEAGVNRKA